MTQARQDVGVAAEPGQRADGAGREDEPVAEAAPGPGGQPGGQLDRHGQTAQVVVDEGRVAHVGGDDHLLVRLPGDKQLAVEKFPRLQRGVDDDVVLALGEAVELSRGEAEAPVAAVVRRPVRNPVGVVGQGVQVRAELVERHPRPRRGAVAHQMQVVIREVHDAATVPIGDPGSADVPLVADRPVEHLRAAGHAHRLEWHGLAQDAQRLAHAVAGQAAAHRVEALHAASHPGGEVWVAARRAGHRHPPVTSGRGSAAGRPAGRPHAAG